MNQARVEKTMKVFDPLTDSPENFIEDLVYINYAHNRKVSPDITPERWGKVFTNWRTLEKRYQQENKT